MKNDPHTSILETYFFDYIDRGIGADETPLFTRTVDGKPLAIVLAEEFSLPLSSAEKAIDIAREEVAL
jgi:hypothetical protein